MPVHTQANPSVKKMTTDMWRGAIRAIFCWELCLPAARQQVSREGPEPVNYRGGGQTGGILAPLTGPPAPFPPAAGIAVC